MQDFGLGCPKQTRLVANTPLIKELELVKRVKAARTIRTTVKYTDGHGVVRYKATPALKGTQRLGGILKAKGLLNRGKER